MCSGGTNNVKFGRQVLMFLLASIEKTSQKIKGLLVITPLNLTTQFIGCLCVSENSTIQSYLSFSRYSRKKIEVFMQ